MKSGALASALETWFATAKRPMPWRLKPTPYHCWLSEIMMQQTTYASVLPYYTRFLKTFPTVETLAKASESAVLKAWEGLGYYARARNLHKAAQQICSTGKAQWPASANAWQELPGIGPYTAAALGSVLSNDRVPVVDGNVARVFSRYWQLKDDFHQQAARTKLAGRLQAEMDKALCAGDFNQAMMELGACVCTPTSPTCEACPLRKDCRSRKAGTQADYPLKPVRKELPVRRRTAIVVRDSRGRVLLVKNTEGGLLKGLWELPLVEPGPEKTQIFSHFRLEISSFKAISKGASFQDPKKVPLSTSTRKLLGLD